VIREREVVIVKRIGLLASLATVVVFFAVPSSAIAGWAGSRYEKSDCTLSTASQGGKPGLYCETYFIGPQEVQSGDLLLMPDDTCPSGVRHVQEMLTLEVTYFGYDFYDGPVPLAKFNTGGDEFPVSSRILSIDHVIAGCA
jgi:hypothetical protein